MTVIVTQQQRWRVIDGARTATYGQLGLQPVDELTGGAPFGRIQATLYISDGIGGWSLTDIKPATTSRGILAYPKLERRGVAAGQPARKYRVQLEAEFYRPVYRAQIDGLEFDVFPYNDAIAPQFASQQRAVEVKLAPATNYPFPSHVPVIRGLVTHVGIPVPDVEVAVSNVERVLTDERGAFSLPVRWKPNNAQFPIDAMNHRTGHSGTLQVKLPLALGKNQIINIS